MYHPLKIEMKEVLERMYPCVSPRRARHGYAFPLQNPESLLDFLLHAVGVLLGLKTTVCFALVGNFQEISWHIRRDGIENRLGGWI